MAIAPGMDEPLGFVEDTGSIKQFKGGTDHQPTLFERWKTFFQKRSEERAVWQAQTAEITTEVKQAKALARAESDARYDAKRDLVNVEIGQREQALDAAEAAVAEAIARRDAARSALDQAKQAGDKVLGAAKRHEARTVAKAGRELDAELKAETAGIDQRYNQAVNADLADTMRYTREVVVHEVTKTANGVVSIGRGVTHGIARVAGNIGDDFSQGYQEGASKPAPFKARQPQV